MGRIFEVPQSPEEEEEEEAGSEEENASQGEGTEAVAEGRQYQLIQRMHASQEEFHMEMREMHQEILVEMREMREEFKVWSEKQGRDLQKILEFLERLPAPVNPASVSSPTPCNAQVQPSSSSP